MFDTGHHRKALRARALSIPVFDRLGLWSLLGQGGLLDLVAPFLVAVGLLRLLLPLPRRGRP